MDQIPTAEALLGAIGLNRSFSRPRRSDFCGSTSLPTSSQAGPKFIFGARAENGSVSQRLGPIEFERAEEASVLAAPS